MRSYWKFTSGLVFTKISFVTLNSVTKGVNAMRVYQCMEVLLTITYLWSPTLSLHFISLCRNLNENNLIVQAGKICSEENLFFFNIIEEMNSLILLNWGKNLFKGLKYFQKMPNKLIIGLQIKYVNQCYPEFMFINLSCTSKVKFQSDYIFLISSDSLTQLIISDLPLIPPSNPDSSLTPTLSRWSFLIIHTENWSHQLTTSSTVGHKTYEFI